MKKEFKIFEYMTPITENAMVLSVWCNSIETFSTSANLATYGQ
jgi:hypothetical protein